MSAARIAVAGAGPVGVALACACRGFEVRIIESSANAQAVSSGGDKESKDDLAKPDLTSLNEGEFGLPRGTPAIHLDILPYCLHLIKIDGHLKILSVSIYVD